MPTYTNLGIKQITTGDEAGTWGTSTNTNFDYFDTAIVGYVSITLATAGTTGSPNTLNVADFSASNGRNRILGYTSATDLGATCYVQITPADFYGYYFVKNSLAGGRDLVIFQGTYNAGRAVTITNGEESIIRCDGAATPVVTRLLNDLQNNSLVTNSIIVAGTSSSNADVIKIGDGNTPYVGYSGTSSNALAIRGDSPATVTAEAKGILLDQNGGDSGSAYTTSAVYGISIADYVAGTNQTVTNYFGVRVLEASSAVSNYGIRSDVLLPTTAGKTKYSFYGGTADAQFNGQVAVGGASRSNLTLLTNGAAAANFYSGATTYTYTGTGTTGTHAASNVFGIVTYAATNATTYTNASTVYVNGPPANGANVTIGTPYAIYVAAGTIKTADLLSGGYQSLSAGTLTLPFNSNNVLRVTPNATGTFTMTAGTVPTSGTSCVLIVATSGTTSYTMTFDSTYFRSSGTLATGTVGGLYFMITFVSDGSKLCECARTTGLA